MAFQNSKNVWGNLDRSSKTNQLNASFNIDSHKGFEKTFQGANNLAFGPFGSKTNSGPTSLPSNGFNSGNSKIFSFELGNCSSDSSCTSSAPTSGPNSIIGFGMEPKKFSWAGKYDQSSDWGSGEASRPSSGFGSRNHMNLGNMVDNVFMEEIGKMADTLQKESCFWK